VSEERAAKLCSDECVAAARAAPTLRRGERSPAEEAPLACADSPRSAALSTLMVDSSDTSRGRAIAASERGVCGAGAMPLELPKKLMPGRRICVW
jgi:hypothetical protein